jgi:hypothetical protein
MCLNHMTDRYNGIWQTHSSKVSLFGGSRHAAPDDHVIGSSRVSSLGSFVVFFFCTGAFAAAATAGAFRIGVKPIRRHLLRLLPPSISRPPTLCVFLCVFAYFSSFPPRRAPPILPPGTSLAVPLSSEVFFWHFVYSFPRFVTCMTVVRIHFKFLVVFNKGEDESTTLAVSVRCACNDDSFAESFLPRTAVRSFATRKRLLPRVSNAPPTQPHCDPCRPSRMATSGCCCSFVAQRRRRKTGSRKMSGSKTIIRSRPNREGKRCVKNEPNVRSIDWYRLLHQALEMPLV